MVHEANSLTALSDAAGVLGVSSTFCAFALAPRARFEYQPT